VYADVRHEVARLVRLGRYLHHPSVEWNGPRGEGEERRKLEDKECVAYLVCMTFFWIPSLRRPRETSGLRGSGFELGVGEVLGIMSK
jgi:hypothetical protein